MRVGVDLNEIGSHSDHLLVPGLPHLSLKPGPGPQNCTCAFSRHSWLFTALVVRVGLTFVWEGRAVIVTSRLSVDIVRYLQRRTDALPKQWVALSDVAEAVRGTDDLIFDQAVDVARCRGWIFVEGKSTAKRACLLANTVSGPTTPALVVSTSSIGSTSPSIEFLPPPGASERVRPLGQ